MRIGLIFEVPLFDGASIFWNLLFQKTVLLTSYNLGERQFKTCKDC